MGKEEETRGITSFPYNLTTESLQHVTQGQKCRAVKILETNILFSYCILNLPHPACCSRPSVFSPYFLTTQNRSLPLLAATPWAGSSGTQGWVQTPTMRGQERLPFILSTTGAQGGRGGGRRQDGCWGP